MNLILSDRLNWWENAKEWSGYQDDSVHQPTSQEEELFRISSQHVQEQVHAGNTKQKENIRKILIEKDRKEASVQFGWSNWMVEEAGC